MSGAAEFALQVPHRQFGDAHDPLFIFRGEPGLELFARRAEDVEVHVRQRAEAPPFDEDRTLVEDLARQQHFAVRAEHRRLAQSALHEVEAHQPVVHRAEADAAELDHVDFDAVGPRLSSSD